VVGIFVECGPDHRTRRTPSATRMVRLGRWFVRGAIGGSGNQWQWAPMEWSGLPFFFPLKRTDHGAPRRGRSTRTGSSSSFPFSCAAFERTILWPIQWQFEASRADAVVRNSSWVWAVAGSNQRFLLRYANALNGAGPSMGLSVPSVPPGGRRSALQTKGSVGHPRRRIVVGLLGKGEGKGGDGAGQILPYFHRGPHGNAGRPTSTCSVRCGRPSQPLLLWHNPQVKPGRSRGYGFPSAWPGKNHHKATPVRPRFPSEPDAELEAFPCAQATTTRPPDGQVGRPAESVVGLRLALGEQMEPMHPRFRGKGRKTKQRRSASKCSVRRANPQSVPGVAINGKYVSPNVSWFRFWGKWPARIKSI